jgi:3',5'-cyclic-AMP phosphodiesterase
MRLAWLSDIHLNFLDDAGANTFVESVAKTASDAIVITGDIAEASDVRYYLWLLSEACDTPIYFVLGNHDFYRGSLANTRREVVDYCLTRPKLTYLSCSGLISLTETTCLIGHDGWCDGLLGRYWDSPVIMNDWYLISEFRDQFKLGKEMEDDIKLVRIELLRTLAQEAADHLMKLLNGPASSFEHIIVATHVPPFERAASYDGGLCDSNYLPHFANQVVGEALETYISQNPKKRMTVLCGHTHGTGEVWITKNLRVLTAGAVYGQPTIQRTIMID